MVFAKGRDNKIWIFTKYICGGKLNFMPVIYRNVCFSCSIRFYASVEHSQVLLLAWTWCSPWRDLWTGMLRAFLTEVIEYVGLNARVNFISLEFTPKWSRTYIIVNPRSIRWHSIAYARTTYNQRIIADTWYNY